MWRMPAFIARAQASTSGTKMKFSRNLMPTRAMPAMRPSSMTSSAEVPASSASRVIRSTVTWSPSMRAAEMACISVLAPANSAIDASRSSGRSMYSSISPRTNTLLMSESSGKVGPPGTGLQACAACHSTTVSRMARRLSMGVCNGMAHSGPTIGTPASSRRQTSARTAAGPLE